MTASADDTPRHENDGKEAAGGESEDRRPHPAMKFVGMEHSDARDSITIPAGAQPSASTVSTSLASDAPETKPSEGVGPNVSDAKTEERATISDGLSFSREPPEAALRLNFEEYALAISRVFRDASGEFCMALLGRWGSGKTRLARLVTTYLSKPDVFSLELKQYGLPRADNDTMQYSIVWFSAWQYRRVPEAWIFLYETFSKALVSPDNTTLILRIARVLRVNVARRGEIDLVFRLCVLAAILAPLQLIGGIVQLLIPILGILGVYQLMSMMRTGPKTVKQLATDYATLTQHSEQLGLQASIGVDLRALLRGWIMRPAPTAEMPESVPGLGPLRLHLALWIIPAVVAVIWAIGLAKELYVDLPDWLNKLAGTDLLNKLALTSIGTKHFGNKVGWESLGLWSIVSFGCAILLRWPADVTKRILLVVDDLDRCLPGELIDIVEAVKLLLEDPALAQRVQVLVLVDEEPLDVAIRERFKALIEARGSAESDASTVREHKEKLFLCALRLPELTPGEVNDLLTAYTAAAPDTVSRTERAALLGQAIAGEKGVEKRGLPNRTDLFTPQERDFLRNAVVRALPPGGRSPTPRQIRSFLSKYQIARALCAYGKFSNPDQLAEGLAKAVFDGAPIVPPNKTRGRFSIEQIIADVV
jgi:hypothetical protein